MLSEWQKERLNESLSNNSDIANASDLQSKKILDLITNVASLPLNQSVDLILDTLDPNSNTDLVVRQAAHLCLTVLCEEQPTYL